MEDIKLKFGHKNVIKLLWHKKPKYWVCVKAQMVERRSKRYPVR